ncbi:MAG TPA: TonB-dependent receptor [Acidobacteriota bacterium]|nr:TonB-dependent receptor [Acidobacteriota bacterium]
MSKPKTVCLSVMLVLLLVTVSFAQSRLGSIKGYVRDDQSAVIVGATVKVNSPSLLGERTTTTSALGYYRITNLPPGDYTLEVTKENFKQYRRTGLLMKAGLTVSVDAVLTVGVFEEIIEISATPPLLEIENPVKAWNFSGDFIRSLPISPDKNWTAVMSMVPGAYMAYGGTELVEQHGASYNSNVPLLDGVHVGSVQSNYLGDAYLPAESLEDIQVVAGFSGADKPSGSGAVVNIVTKSGGDAFHGESTFDIQMPSWNGVNTDGGTPQDSTIYKPSFSIGGPIFKDKTWFFSNLSYTHTRNGIYRTPEDVANLKAFDPSFEPFDQTSKQVAWMNKITHQLNSKVQFVFNYLYNTDSVTNSANRNETESGARGQTYGGPLYSGQFSWDINDNANFRVLFGWKEGGFKTRPQGGSGPNVRWYTSTYLSGGRIYGNGLLASTDNITGYNHGLHDRVTFSADFDYFIDDLWGSHEIKAGTFMQPVIRDVMDMYSSNNGFVQEYRVLNDPSNPSAGYKTFYKKEEFPAVLTGWRKVTRQYDYYLSDAWRPTEKLVLNFGLKVSQAISVDSFDIEQQNSWGYSPSIGATYQVTGDGMNILRAGWSRNYDQMMNLGTFQSGSYRKGYTYFYDTNMDGVWDSTLSGAAILEPQPPDPRYGTDDGLSQPYTDEFTLGFQRQLPWRISLDVAYYHREIKNRISRIEVNGVYDANGSLVGVKDQNLDLVYSTANVKASKVVFDGFEINVHKNLSDNLQFLLGYSYSHGAMAGEYEESDPAHWLQPDTFANNRGFGSVSAYSTYYANAYQVSYYNSGIAPHSFKAAATYFGPLGINLGVNFVWQQGKWQGAIMEMIPAGDVKYPTYIYLPNGSRVSNPIATRSRFAYGDRSEGQGRAPAFSYVNLRVAKEFTLFDRYRFEIAANVFNLFNRGADMYWYYGANQDWNTNFGKTYGAQSPRAGQINLRFIF